MFVGCGSPKRTVAPASDVCEQPAPGASDWVGPSALRQTAFAITAVASQFAAVHWMFVALPQLQSQTAVPASRPVSSSPPNAVG
jgi:hypothetical protein